jgi:hypothetical protein
MLFFNHLEWQALEIRADLEIPTYWTNVFKRFEGMLAQYDNFDVRLPACDVQGTSASIHSAAQFVLPRPGRSKQPDVSVRTSGSESGSV